MLAPVGLDSGSVGRLQKGDTTSEELAHKMLLNALQDHGIVVFGGHSDKEQFLSAVRELPGAIRKLWASAFGHIPHVVSQRELPQSVEEVIDSSGELETSWHGAVDVILAERDRAVNLGLPLTTPSFVTACGVEIARMEHAEASRVLSGLRRLAYEALHSGEDREAVWRQRFAGAARFSSVATIVDRYATQAHLRRRNADEDSGLEWLVGKIGEAGVPHVHVITRSNQSVAAFNEMIGMEGRLADPPTSMSVTFVGESAFRRAGHSRHIRLDRWGFTMDKGCDLFSSQLLEEESPTQYGDVPSLRKREHALEQAAQADALRVRIWPR